MSRPFKISSDDAELRPFKSAPITITSDGARGVFFWNLQHPTLVTGIEFQNGSQFDVDAEIVSVLMASRELLAVPGVPLVVVCHRQTADDESLATRIARAFDEVPRVQLCFGTGYPGDGFRIDVRFRGTLTLCFVGEVVIFSD